MDCDRSTFDDNKSALTQSSRSPDFQSCLGNVALETRFCEDSGQSTPFLLQQGFLLPCTLSGDLEHRDLLLDHKVAGWNISAGSSRRPRPRDHRSSSSRRHSCWFRTLASPGTRGPRCNPPLPQSRGRHLVEDGSSAPHHYKLSSTLAAPPERPSPPRRCLRPPTLSPSKKGIVEGHTHSSNLTWASWQLEMVDVGCQRNALQFCSLAQRPAQS